ncbi:MAG TPA: glycosyltransferase family 4 protein [Nitrospiraceae bacterium]|nr:glycosyltransferase family 4 protein [Nitrospiraceae bacterium]
MNIIIVSDFAHVSGGNAAVALTSASGLARQGHAVTVFAGVGPVGAEIASGPVKVICTGQQAIADDPRRTRAVVQGIWNVKAARMMAEALRSMDLSRTVVHVHGWDKALSSSVVRTALSLGAKVVCTFHDYVSVCPNGGFYNHSRDEICRLRPLSLACVMESCDRRGYGQKLWRVVRHSVQRRWGLLPDAVKHVVVVSDFSRRVLEPFLPAGIRIHPVPNMIGVIRTTPAAPADNSAYVMVGRMSREKGPHLLASVAGRTGWSVKFIGDGESVTDIRRLAPGATVTGWLSRDAVLKEIAQARALIFPSLWYEGEPLVILEAAALGIPAVVADSCAARDLVIDGETGLYFRSGDDRDLQSVMERLQDRDLVRRMGEAAYGRYWSNPRSLERHLADLERVYELVLRDE